MRVIGAVRIDGVGDGIAAVAGVEPDLIVVLAVAGGGVDEARTGVVGDVAAGEEGDGKTIAVIKLCQRMTSAQASWINLIKPRPLRNLGGGSDIGGQLVGHDQEVAWLGPRLEGEALFHGYDFIHAVGDFRVVRYRPIG